MSIITNWPKNAVSPSDYQINTSVFGKPMEISKTIDLVGELSPLFDIDQEANCLEIFVYTGGTCSPYTLRQHLERRNGYESDLLAIDKHTYIHRIEISRKTSWKDYSTIAMFDRIPDLDNTFAITSNLIRLKPAELSCFKDILSIIANLPGRYYSVELPELPLIALINEMNGKV